MKKLVALLLVLIFCITVITGGRLTYNKKLNNIANSAVDEYKAALIELEQKEMEAIAMEEARIETLLHTLTEGLNNQIKELILENYHQDGDVKILVFGTNNVILENEDGKSWPKIAEDRLNEAYEKDMFVFESKSFGDRTSIQIIEEGLHVQLAENDADIVLIESSIWNDSIGQVAPADTRTVLSMKMNAIERENEDAVILVHPAPPVYDTQFYPIYVEELKEFVIEEGYLYIDYWTDWPSIDDEVLLNYVNDGGSSLTDLGKLSLSENILDIFMNK
ncbi:SGNH/GDSL hydrolase family protein [Evansella cellulosilytica]|uniref:SGNH/GDSL hydrolase family protein n=1 Tax=Evansella cellulosilytica (strain ATCC 21833 / DSM 2522 / FERM P-1141 / JCM 9156 / N-4) TaxID=649639 RepID=E6TSC5_EVAC2|nr:SGNH/GDSL hydrolase family protein [Evansella cellulosilytica]ADU31894.1 hypothetical protein Bcell_3653 [Evansella cellulosilytica DSM 2522]